jgi:hypothetical protein
VVSRGDTIYGFSNDGHLMMVGANEMTPRAYQLNLRINTVHGVTEDGVAILGNGGTIYLVDLSV